MSDRHLLDADAKPGRPVEATANARVQPEWKRWASLMAITALNTSAQSAMYVLAYLYAIEDSYGSFESIRAALGLTSTMYGLLMSYIRCACVYVVMAVKRQAQAGVRPHMALSHACCI